MTIILCKFGYDSWYIYRRNNKTIMEDGEYLTKNKNWVDREIWSENPLLAERVCFFNTRRYALQVLNMIEKKFTLIER